MGTGNAPRRCDQLDIIGKLAFDRAGESRRGEYEVKNAQAMTIMTRWAFGGSFTEYYAMDFADDIVLMGMMGRGISRSRRGRPRFGVLKRLSAKWVEDCRWRCREAWSGCVAVCQSSLLAMGN